jgi:hypothetical protein
MKFNINITTIKPKINRIPDSNYYQITNKNLFDIKTRLYNLQVKLLGLIKQLLKKVAYQMLISVLMI